MRDNRIIDPIIIILCFVLLLIFCNTYVCDNARAQDIGIPRFSDNPTGEEMTEAFKRLYRYLNALLSETSGTHIWPAQETDTIYLDLRFSNITYVGVTSKNIQAQNFIFVGTIGSESRGDTAVIMKKQYYASAVDTAYYLVKGFKKLEK